MTTTENKLKDLAHFTGSEQWHYHSMHKDVIYTDGVQYVAEQAGAYWLLDVIAIGAKQQGHEYPFNFQVWELHLNENDSGCVITATTGNDEPPFYKQEIEYTDFPQDFKIYCSYDGVRWTILLPSEY